MVLCLKARESRSPPVLPFTYPFLLFLFILLLSYGFLYWKPFLYSENPASFMEFGLDVSKLVRISYGIIFYISKVSFEECIFLKLHVRH